MRIPSYRLHKASGQAVIEYGGEVHYLGKHGSAKSKQKYREHVAKWSARANVPAQQQQPTPDSPPLIKGLILRYWTEHVTTYYVKHGKPTSEQSGIKAALKKLRRLFGDVDAAEFDELKLETYRDELIEDGLRVTTINQHVGRLRRMFRWGAKKKLVPAAVWQQLLTVENLKTGRTKAKPPRGVKPVDDEVIERTLPHLSDVVAAMVRLQRLTGCRPTEVCLIRPCDIERPARDPQQRLDFGAQPEAEVWIYRPGRHKTEHHGRERRIYLGPKAQAVLQPWLNRDSEAYCFSPREATTAEACGEPAETLPFMQAAPRLGRRGACYNKDSYRHAIIYGLCKLAQSLGHKLPAAPAIAGKRKDEKKAKWRPPKREWFESVGIAYFHPNQIRHTAATKLRSKYDLEAAGTVLGHEKMSVTEVYAERDFARAEQIMRESG